IDLRLYPKYMMDAPSKRRDPRGLGTGLGIGPSWIRPTCHYPCSRGFFMNEHDNKLKELAELLAASEEKRHHDLVQQQNVIEAMAADLHRVRRQRDGM